MKTKIRARNTREFDRRFDSGEDIHDLIDMSKATVLHTGKKVRLTLDVAESLVQVNLSPKREFYCRHISRPSIPA